MNPLALFAAPKAMAALLVAGGLVLSHGAVWWHGLNKGKRDERNLTTAVTLEATQANAATSIRRADNVIAAQNERAENAKTAQTLAARVAAAERRLRDAVARGSAAPNSSPDACAQRAATLDELFGDCRSALVEMGKTATGHAADSLMYQRAWPR